MSDRPALSVVLPLYRTRAAVPELTRRLLASVAPVAAPLELVFVDDCCPERSYEVVPAGPIDGTAVVVHRHERRSGQHAALITGMGLARGELVAVMDADLQDAPEDLAVLVEAWRRSPRMLDAVAAGRQGTYESWWRQSSGRAYRWLVSQLTSGRIPPGAGLFLVMTASARDRVLALGVADIHPLAALGRLGATIDVVPVVRRARPYGFTSYTAWGRARAAVRALGVLIRGLPGV